MGATQGLLMFRIFSSTSGFRASSLRNSLRTKESVPAEAPVSGSPSRESDPEEELRIIVVVTIEERGLQLEGFAAKGVDG